jgi:exodeoxyribonuclease X
MTDWTSLNYAVIDVEGNGQQPPDLVELAVVPIRSGVIGEAASWLVRPGEPIRPFATRIHGLTNEDVAEAPLFTAIANQVLAALDMAALVAQNAHVDVDVLTRKLAGWQPPEVFDTLRIARRLLPGWASYRLGALTSAFHLDDGLPSGLSPHRAEYDALVTARLFVKMATRLITLEELRGSPPGKGEDDAPSLF